MSQPRPGQTTTGCGRAPIVRFSTTGGERSYTTMVADHLGSTRAEVRDASPADFAAIDYWPYGELVSQPPTLEEHHLFTGHEREFIGAASGVDPLEGRDYMHARYYGFNLGRFVSVDPVGGEVGSSQSWNRYAYARNSPVVRADPDGRADLRTPQEKGILEDPSVLAAVGQIVKTTGFDQRLQDRVEAATVVAVNSDSSLSTTGVVTGELQGVNPPDVKDAVVTDTGQASIATIHSHPGTGYIGRGLFMHGGKASDADKCFADVSGTLSFIVNGSPDARDRTTRKTSSLIAYDPAKGSETAVLTENDYRQYLARAVQEYQQHTANGK